MNFSVTSERTPGAVVLALEGELDLSTVGDAESAFRELERSSDSRPVVIDLRRLAFIDSTGLRFVLAADARVRRDGGRLVVLRGPASVQRVFGLARLEQRLEFAGSLEEVRSGDGEP